MEDKRETMVAGVGTGDYTESGNNKHNADGTFGSKEGGGTKKVSALDKIFSKKKGFKKLGVETNGQNQNINDIFQREIEFSQMSPGIITLLNYTKHREERKKWISTEGWTKEEEREINKVFQKIQKESCLARNMSTSDILGVFTSGHLFNLFEAGRGEGYVGSDRIPASANMFGAEVKQSWYHTSDPEKRKKLNDLEKYGYLGLKNISDLIDNRDGGWYGGSTIILNREKMRNRVTYSIEDSLGAALNNSLLPQLLDRPFDSAAISGNSERRKMLRNYTRVLNSRNVQEFKQNCDVNYIELQYHGEVTPADISAICMSPREVKSSTGKSILKFCKELPYGIKVFTKDRDGTLYKASLNDIGEVDLVEASEEEKNGEQ